MRSMSKRGEGVRRREGELCVGIACGRAARRGRLRRHGARSVARQYLDRAERGHLDLLLFGQLAIERLEALIGQLESANG